MGTGRWEHPVLESPWIAKIIILNFGGVVLRESLGSLLRVL